jgi:hypothetical protein
VKKLIYWLILVLVLFLPIIIGFVFAQEIVPVARKIYTYWVDKPIQVFLSDLFFIEAGGFLIIGALVAGVTLYNTWAALDVRTVQFTDYIWNWRRMKEERKSSAGLIVGLTMLAVGVVYFIVAIVVPFGVIPVP